MRFSIKLKKVATNSSVILVSGDRRVRSLTNLCQIGHITRFNGICFVSVKKDLLAYWLKRGATFSNSWLASFLK